MKTAFNKNSLGFTLVEILVVLLIVVALTILILSGYSEGRPRLAVERTTEAFVADLYRARQRGFSGVGYKIDEKVVGVDGHGIEIDLSAEQGDGYYNMYVKGSSDKEIIERIEIENSVVISNLSIGPYNREKINIFFEKEGGVKVNGNPENDVKIVFSSKNDSSIRRSVIIDNKGVAKISYD